MMVSEYSKDKVHNPMTYCGCDSATFVCSLVFYFTKDKIHTNVCQDHRKLWEKKAGQLDVRTEIKEVMVP